MTRQEQIEQAKDGYMRRIGAEPRADEDRNNLDVVDAYIAAAQWADRTMIERASHWLQTAIYLDYENSIEHRYETMEELINNFKQAMQDE